jgi:NADPH:quinone reductase-like Zn-dependent oxidoreductase
MKAIVLNRSIPDKIELIDAGLPSLKAHEVRISLVASALNHRDEWSRQGLYPNLRDGVILGSDGAGTVVEIGSGVSTDWLGKEVIINPAIDWGAEEHAKSNDFKILGIPDNGTLAEYVQVPSDRLHHKPAHLSWEEAAALPLAGLTAYRAVFVQGGLQKKEKVLITGIGGGVAQFAAQYAHAAGADAYVSSSSPEKIDKAKQLGVLEGFNYKDPNWVEAVKTSVGGFDLIIDSAMGDTINDLIDAVNPGGRIIFFGATMGNPSGFNARKVYWNQITIKGSTMGSDNDFLRMLEFVNERKIVPIVDKVYGMKDAIAAFERMKAGQQMGKIVIRIS